MRLQGTLAEVSAQVPGNPWDWEFAHGYKVPEFVVDSQFFISVFVSFLSPFITHTHDFCRRHPASRRKEEETGVYQ